MLRLFVLSNPVVSDDVVATELQDSFFKMLLLFLELHMIDSMSFAMDCCVEVAADISVLLLTHKQDKAKSLYRTRVPGLCDAHFHNCMMLDSLGIRLFLSLFVMLVATVDGMNFIEK